MEKIVGFFKGFLVIVSASSIIGGAGWILLWNMKAEAAVKQCIQNEIHPVRNRTIRNEKKINSLEVENKNFERKINEIKRLQVWVVTKLGGDPNIIIK